MSVELSRGLCGSICIAACLFALLSSTRVRASDVLRVVVRIASSADRALLPRVQGQLSDVNAQLIVVETAAPSEDFADQVEAAQALAAREHADVVLWFAVPKSGASAHAVLVHVFTPGEQRIFTRRLSLEGNGSATATVADKLDSSVLEAAALAVRSAVNALAAGGSIGITTHEALAESKQRAQPSRERDDGAAAVGGLPEHTSDTPSPFEQQLLAASHHDDGRYRDAGPGHSRLAARFYLGVQSVIDGESKLGQRGLFARASVGMGALSVSVYGSYGLPVGIDDALFALEVARHAAGGALDLRTDLSERTSFALGVHAGAALFARTSAAKTPEAKPNPAALTPALEFGPEVAFAWLFGKWLDLGFGLAAQLALDVLPFAPSFEASGGGDRHRLWAFQPRLSVGLEGVVP